MITVIRTKNTIFDQSSVYFVERVTKSNSEISGDRHKISEIS